MIGNKWFGSLALFGAITLCLPGLASGAGKYHIAKKVKLAGDSGWDYLTVDGAAKRLYVTRGTFVAVLDTQTGEELGRIAGTDGVHGVALAPDLGRGFTSNGKAATVTVFDLKTLKTLGTVPTGKKPDAIVYDPASKRVLAMNGGSASVTVIDAVKATALGTIPLKGRPEFAAADGKGKVFVDIEDKNLIAKLDPVKMTVAAEWGIAPCDEPSGLAIDPEHERLFAVCHNERMAVVDSSSGKVVATLPIGKGVDAAAYDAARHLVFSSNGEGTLSVFRQDSPDKYSPVATVPTQKSARTMALDPTTHRVFTVAADFGPRVPGSRRPPIIPGSVVLLVIE